METTLLLAGDPAEPEGVGVLALESGVNGHVAHIDVHVPPHLRRRGIGAALLAAAEADARAAGRTLALTETFSLAPSGLAFFEALGYERGLVLRCNRLDLRSLDRSLLASWVADPDPGYELRLVRGRMPDELVPAAIQAVAAMNDAPTDDLDVEDQVTTEAHLRAWEAASSAMGQERLFLMALHRATGEGAGFTGVRWSPHQPTVVWQGGTATTPAHRGHRLGRLLKATMLLHLLEQVPDATEVRTENAHSNGHMLAINDELGFTPFAEQVIAQKRL